MTKALQKLPPVRQAWRPQHYSPPKYFPPKNFTAAPDAIPYGFWRTEDGREILFDRGYLPIMERSPEKTARQPDPSAWIAVVAIQWLHEGCADFRRAKFAPLKATLERIVADFSNGAPMPCVEVIASPEK